MAEKEVNAELLDLYFKNKGKRAALGLKSCPKNYLESKIDYSRKNLKILLDYSGLKKK